MNLEKDVALERIVTAKGIELVANGAKLVGRCPFGEHDAASLIIDPKANTWTCSEGCGSGGVVAFVAKAEGVSVAHAIELLKGDFTPEPGEVAKKSTRLIGASIMEPDEPDAVVLDRVLAYYTRTLLDSPEALAFLHERGIRDPDVIPHFKLGYCDRTLGYRIPKANRKAGAAIRGQLLRLGLLRESGHEHLRGSIAVPVFNEAGRVVNVYGRKVRDDLRAGTPDEVWLNEAENGVLNAPGLVENGKVILAGSVLDTLAWWSHGHRNVTTTFGRSTLPVAVREQLVVRKIRSVAVAFRRDNDGDKALDAIATELRALGVEVTRVLFPAGSDAVAVVKVGGSLDAALKAANWVSAGTPVERPPAAPGTTTEAEPTSDTGEVVLTYGDRRWRVRGLSENTSHGSIRVNLLVSRGDTAAFHVDTIELYSARQRAAFLAAASSEVGVEERILKKDLGSVLLALEKLVDERIRATLAPEKVAVAITEGDRDKALGFLRDPAILDRIVSDFDALGVVGERTNKLVAYLAAVSRELPRPLAVVLQSSPASGKSALLEATLKLIPTEDVLAFSAITGRSLFYLPADGLAHKVLAIAEEEGAGKAAYALKLLHSEGALSIASTAKDTKTGRLATHTYGVNGPVALLLTTTALDVDEELLSRCIVLGADESREHTRAIHREQRRRLTVEGLGANHEAVVKLHHDAQRLLRALHVVVPEGLALDFANHRVGTRRDHAKVLGLVQALGLLLQHQRPVRETDAGVKYVEVTERDVAVAVKLLGDASGKVVEDLPPGTRALLGAIKGHVVALAEQGGIDPSDVRFTRRALREALSLGDTRLKVHLARLVNLEYVLVHATRGVTGRKVAYELVCGYDEDRAGHGRPTVAPESPHGRPSVGPGSSGA